MQCYDVLKGHSPVEISKRPGLMQAKVH